MKYSVLVLCLLLPSSSALAQNECAPPPIVFNKNAQNLFDEKQETYLGEVMAEYVTKNYRIISDDETNRYLRTLGEKIAQHLPPTNLKFQFYVVDLPDLNAFAAVGGRIYITRKMIAFVRSEDELAGIIGHELGHAIVRHGSQDLSRYFRQILNVDKVGDRADIYSKFHDFIDKQRTKQIRASQDHANDQQLEADRIGLFAMSAAGYDPSGYASAWDRLAETRGRKGSALSDFFGTINPNQKRLREIIKAAAIVPAACLDKKTQKGADEFGKWQSYIVTTSAFSKSPKLPGLVSQGSLNPYLRGEVKHFEFSPDGQYVLAQDASGINVLSRVPFKFLFRIDATDAKYASFSADSKTVSFQTYGLRVETWDVATQALVIAREVYNRGSCWQSKLSQDGKYLVCYSVTGALNIIEVATSEKVFTKEKFYLPSFLEFLTWTYMRIEGEEKEINALQMEFSPDGKYFLGGRVFRFSRGGSASMYGGLITMSWGIDADQEAFIAYDLLQKRETKLAGDLKNIVSMPFAFYSNDKLIGQHRKDPDKSGIFTYPEGKRVERFFMNADSYRKANNAEYLMVRPTVANPVGVFDLKTKTFVLGNRTPALDGWGEFFVSEGRDGIVDLFRLNKATDELQTVASVDLPKNNIGDVRSITASHDLKWLAISESSRGGVWALADGQMKVYMRGHKGSVFDRHDNLFADFSAFEKSRRSMGVVNPATNTLALLQPIEGLRAKQLGKYLVTVSTKEDEKLAKKEEERAKSGKDDPGGRPASGATEDERRKKPTFEFSGGWLTGIDMARPQLSDGAISVVDAVSRKPLWGRAFEDEIPFYDFSPVGDLVCFYWNLTTKTARAEVKKHPDLAERAKKMGEKAGDYLVQIVDAKTGNVAGNVLVETGEGSFEIKRAVAFGDWLAVADSENRILFYSIKTGTLVWRFFGDKVEVKAERSLATIENLSGQLAIYDLRNGSRLTELVFPNKVLYSTFSESGDRYLVVTADQNYYLFRTDQFGSGILSMTTP